MSKPSPQRIRQELQDMLLNQYDNLYTPDQQVKEIFEKFIKPLLDYCEYLRLRNEAERAVPFADEKQGLPSDFTVIHH